MVEPVDPRVIEQMHLVHDLVDQWHADMQAHVNAARTAFMDRNATAHAAALDALSKGGAAWNEKRTQLATAFASGAPTNVNPRQTPAPPGGAPFARPEQPESAAREERERREATPPVKK
jgi:hypothetical protein